jgi:hypothetical protein
MGTRRTGNGFNLISFTYTKIRKPSMKAKQWIVICGEVLRRCLLRDRAIEHPADGGTVEIRRRHAKADDAAGEDVDHDHNPVCGEFLISPESAIRHTQLRVRLRTLQSVLCGTPAMNADDGKMRLSGLIITHKTNRELMIAENG